MFDEHLYVKGIKYINDILKPDGTFLTFSEIKNEYGTKLNFIQYHGLLKCIKQICKHCAPSKIIGPLKPLKLALLIQFEKSCKPFYDLLEKKNYYKPRCEEKWENILNTILGVDEWEKIHLLPFKCTKNIKLQWFQYRLQQRILATNKYLKMIGIQNNDNCDFCNSAIETLQHLFYECSVVKRFWEDFLQYLSNNTHYIVCNFTQRFVLLGGTMHTENIINMMFINAKLYIYSCKMKMSNPNVHHFIKYLYLEYKMEKYNAYTSCLYNDFEKRWAPIKSLFCNI